MTAVLDSSAVLAVIFGEPGGDVVTETLSDGATIGPVNLAEVVARLVDEGYSGPDLQRTVEELQALVPEFGPRLGFEAGALRAATRSRGLSLGDRCCLALARALGARVLTADRAWAGLDVGVEIEVIR